MHPVEPSAEHRWLARFVGDWTWTSEEVPGGPWPHQPAAGTETWRALGTFWVQGESTGAHGANVTTLGFAPHVGRFVGTFVGEHMPHLWVYDGELDPTGQRLDLRAEGPGFGDDRALAAYVDEYEFVSDDERVLRARIQNADGSWTHFMTTRYRRA